MPRYYHLYANGRKDGIREITRDEYLNRNLRGYLLAIYHEDGTINLVKGRNIITLPRQHLETLLAATKEAQA